MGKRMNRQEAARLLGYKNRKHGAASARTPEYRSWESMKARCYNPNNPDYAHYGARGIGVDPRWKADFSAFLADMGERPLGTSLDRIDNDGPYCRANCRWAADSIQGRNKRTNVLVEWYGARLTLVELSERTGKPYSRLHERIVRRGWSVDRAVSAPPRGHREASQP